MKFQRFGKVGFQTKYERKSLCDFCLKILDRGWYYKTKCFRLKKEIINFSKKFPSQKHLVTRYAFGQNVWVEFSALHIKFQWFKFWLFVIHFTLIERNASSKSLIWGHGAVIEITHPVFSDILRNSQKVRFLTCFSHRIPMFSLGS